MLAFLKQQIIRFLLAFPGDAGLKNRALILMYHAVDRNQSALTVSPEVFASQLHYLKERQFQLVTLTELIQHLDRGQSIAGLVALTFDDGYQNFYTQVWPWLWREGIPATVFISQNLLGQNFTTSEGISMPLLTKEQITEIQQGSHPSIEFQSHTASHQDLAQLPVESFDQEIGEGYGRSILAYPKGRYRPAVLSYLKAKHWLAAVTVQPGFISPKSDRYQLPRNAVGRDISLPHFKLLVSHRLDYFLIVKRLPRFTVAGLTGAATNIFFLYFFTDWLGLWYLWSGILAFGLSIVVGFWLQKWWAFREQSKHRTPKQFALFLAVAILNLVINTWLLYLFTDRVGLYYLWSQILASGLIAGESFFAYKFIFNPAASY